MKKFTVVLTTLIIALSIVSFMFGWRAAKRNYNSYPVLPVKSNLVMDTLACKYKDSAIVEILRLNPDTMLVDSFYIPLSEVAGK